MELETPYELHDATSKSRTLGMKYLWVFEVLVLIPTMLLIMGLFSIPTILYATSSGVETEVRLDRLAC